MLLCAVNTSLEREEHNLLHWVETTWTSSRKTDWRCLSWVISDLTVTIYDCAQLAWHLWNSISHSPGGVGPVSMSATEGTTPLLISHGFCLKVVLSKTRVGHTFLHWRKTWAEPGDSISLSNREVWPGGWKLLLWYIFSPTQHILWEAVRNLQIYFILTAFTSNFSALSLDTYSGGLLDSSCNEWGERSTTRAQSISLILDLCLWMRCIAPWKRLLGTP